MPTLGLRHLALNVKDVKRSKRFYMDFFGMDCQWEPDAENVYLSSQAQDNLALHEKKDLQIDADQQALDHLGFIAVSPAQVEAYYERAIAQQIAVVAGPKRHRDGAYSCYVRDPDGYVVQIIYHPAIVAADVK